MMSNAEKEILGKNVQITMREAENRSLEIMPSYCKESIDCLKELAIEAAHLGEADSPEAHCLGMCLTVINKVESGGLGGMSIPDTMVALTKIHAWYDAAERIILEKKNKKHGDDDNTFAYVPIRKAVSKND